jgi:hypothetical protein
MSRFATCQPHESHNAARLIIGQQEKRWRGGKEKIEGFAEAALVARHEW